MIGPNGEIRPASAMKNAHTICRILAGETEEEYVEGKPDLRAGRVMHTFDAEDPDSVEAFSDDEHN